MSSSIAYVRIVDVENATITWESVGVAGNRSARYGETGALAVLLGQSLFLCRGGKRISWPTSPLATSLLDIIRDPVRWQKLTEEIIVAHDIIITARECKSSTAREIADELIEDAEDAGLTGEEAALRFAPYALHSTEFSSSKYAKHLRAGDEFPTTATDLAKDVLRAAQKVAPKPTPTAKPK